MPSSLFARVLLGFAVLIVVFAGWWIFTGWSTGSPKLVISKRTTYFTGPLKPDGTVDYFAALNARFRDGVTPESNAAIPLLEVLGPAGREDLDEAELCRHLGIDALRDDGPVFQPLADYFEEHPPQRDYVAESAAPAARDDSSERDIDKSPESRTADASPADQASAAQEAVGHGRWRRSDHPDVAAWLDANRAALDRVAEAVKRPHAYWPLLPPAGQSDAQVLDALMPWLGAAREVDEALRMRAMLRLGEGRPAAGLGDLRAMHRLGRHLDDSPFQISVLVGLAPEAMALESTVAWIESPDVSAELLASHRRWLDELDHLRPMADAVESFDRCGMLDAMDQLSDRGAASLPGAPSVGHQSLIDSAILLGTINRHFDRLAAAMRIAAPPKRMAELQAIEHELEQQMQQMESTTWFLLSIPPYHRSATISRQIARAVLSFITPGMAGSEEIALRGRATFELSRIALALGIHQRRHGRYPASLAALVGPFYDELPPDPLDATRPVRYERTPTGFKLWSVGVDFDDDGGIAYSDPAARKSGSDIGGDIVVEVGEGEAERGGGADD